MTLLVDVVMNNAISFNEPLTYDEYESTVMTAQLPCFTPSHNSVRQTQGRAEVGKEMRLLGRSFRPGSFDVICARGAEAKHHAGNVNLRRKIREASDAYTKAPSKLYKSMIVSSIIEWVRLKSPKGGFVKRMEDGIWYEVGNTVAREKIGQALRDRNFMQYKSSMRAKRRRWKKQRNETSPGLTFWSEDDTFETRMQLHQGTIERSLERIEEKYNELGGQAANEEELMQFFTMHNSNLLETIKIDKPQDDTRIL